MMKARFFEYFSQEIIQRPEYYVIGEGKEEELDFDLLAKEAQLHFEYFSDSVENWVMEWWSDILLLTN